MSDQITIEKAGMLINAEKEVLGWVNAGDVIETKEGDIVVSHPKTAEKHGVAEQYATLKAENAPAKSKKAAAADGDKAPRVRSVCPKTGSYTVVKARAADLKEGETAGERHAIFSKLLGGNDFEAFWDGTPETFQHPNRDGSEMKSFSTSGLVLYAIKRGMITVNA